MALYGQQAHKHAGQAQIFQGCALFASTSKCIAADFNRFVVKLTNCVAGQIYEQDGVRGFYRGCSANLLRTTPAAALTFTTFELIVRHMKAAAAARREA